MASSWPARQAKERERIASGLCAWCGEPRGKGGTTRLCAACVTKRRERDRRDTARHAALHPTASRDYQRRLHANRVAAGLCRQCGRPLPSAGAYLACAVCREKDRVKAQKRREALRGEAPRRDVGNALPKLEGRATGIQVQLDIRLMGVFNNLLDAYRDREISLGRKPLTHPRSHVIREIIRRWDPSRWPHLCPRRDRPHLTFYSFSVKLDAPCRAILDRHLLLHGARTEALRAMIEAAEPKKYATGGPRRLPRWDDER